MDLASKVPFPTLRHPYQFDPVMDRRILSDNVISAISRAVAYNYPFHRPYRLGCNSLYGHFNVLDLIPCRGNHYIVWELQHAMTRPVLVKDRIEGVPCDKAML